MSNTGRSASAVPLLTPAQAARQGRSALALLPFSPPGEGSHPGPWCGWRGGWADLLPWRLSGRSHNPGHRGFNCESRPHEGAFTVSIPGATVTDVTGKIPNILNSHPQTKRIIIHAGAKDIARQQASETSPTFLTSSHSPRWLFLTLMCSGRGYIFLGQTGFTWTDQVTACCQPTWHTAYSTLIFLNPHQLLCTPLIWWFLLPFIQLHLWPPYPQHRTWTS